MPELPEVEGLTRFLDGRVAGRRTTRAQLGSVAALKTFDPPLDALVGRELAGCHRRGKFVCLDADGLWLVVHLALGGWVRWYDALPATRPTPGRGPVALRLGLSADDEAARAPGLDVTERGTEKRLALWVVPELAAVEPLATLGPDPLDPAFDARALAGRLAGQPGTIKTALTRQQVVAGVGNAYSDEALHAARLSPFKPAARLDEDELARLHAALVGVLTAAVDRAAGRPAAELKDVKRAAMAVHGRTGESCPVCGDTVREVAFAHRSLQYCPTCQTGGRPLADRRLSRFVR